MEEHLALSKRIKGRKKEASKIGSLTLRFFKGNRRPTL